MPNHVKLILNVILSLKDITRYAPNVKISIIYPDTTPLAMTNG